MNQRGLVFQYNVLQAVKDDRAAAVSACVRLKEVGAVVPLDRAVQRHESYVFTPSCVQSFSALGLTAEHAHADLGAPCAVHLLLCYLCYVLCLRAVSRRRR